MMLSLKATCYLICIYNGSRSDEWTVVCLLLLRPNTANVII
jgi:hypothetical protein